MKVSELSGALLDYWVARAEGRPLEFIECAPFGESFIDVPDNDQGEDSFKMWSPSRLWKDGGPLIEREQIAIAWNGKSWEAGLPEKEGAGFPGDVIIKWYWEEGSTPLEAAMRAYVANKFGEDVPDETK